MTSPGTFFNLTRLPITTGTGTFFSLTRSSTSGGTFLFLTLLALACASCTPGAHAPSRGASAGGDPDGGPAVVVRVAFREVALPGARVAWSRTAAPGEAPVAVGVTDAGGKASAALAPGRYFLVAQWRADGDYSRPIAPGDRFAWFGGNPVYASRGPVREIFLSVEEFPSPPPPAASPAGATGVSGFVLSGGAPVPDAHVSAYLKAEGGFRDMGFAASAPTGPDGGFVLDLPPGAYYLVARKRASGGVAGPLRKGDAFGYYPANPVTVVAGALTPAALPVTWLKLRNIPSYSGESAAAAFVEGRILGRDGRPRAGAYAALYDNPDLLNRPVFLSDVTGGDGRYRLPVPVPGRYYLGARNGYGGSPAPGDLYGRFEGTPDHSLVVGDGDRLTGVDIVVDEVW